jgi:FkbM family methyltransferase
LPDCSQELLEKAGAAREDGRSPSSIHSRPATYALALCWQCTYSREQSTDIAGHVMLIDVVATLLRSKLIPRALSYKLWLLFSKQRGGKQFHFRTRVFGRSLIYGGVAGSTDNALYTDLEHYEPELNSVLQRCIRKVPEPVVLDIGAHNGEYVLKIKALSPAAQIHAFEPFPLLADFIESLVQKNILAGVVVNRLVASASNGSAKVHFHHDMSCASTVAGFQPDFSAAIETTAIRLDDYVASRLLTRVDLLKIDVEGGELEVIEGAQDLLARFSPTLIVELLYTTHPEHLQRQQRLVELLLRLDYRFYRVEAGGTLTPEPVPTPDASYRYPNYLVAREAP